MRKNKFLLSLIAATAISLSVFGCDSSSSSGSVADTTDITVPGNNDQQNERQNLREYMVLGQRGITTFTPTFGAGQSAPAGAVAVVAGSGDGVLDSGRAQLYELVGISNVPEPNANILPPGDASEAPVPTGTAGTTGYHAVDVDPSGNYVIGISRARDRGLTADDRAAVESAQMQIFKLEFTPLDVVYPPEVNFTAVPAATDSIIFLGDGALPFDQGKFVSGLWSPDSSHYYASIQSTIHVFRVELNIGRLNLVQSNAFPAVPAGNNNAVKMLFSKDGRFLYALDNANNNIVRWDRNLTTGELSNQVNIATVADPRGFDIDRTGNFLYVVGRSSGLLAGYRIGTDGSLSPIEVFSGLTAVPTSLPGAPALGDVDFNPITDQLVVATYAGVIQAYPIDLTTGALQVVASGSAASLVNLSRNTTNIEIEPTGRFVLAVQESDLEEFQTYVAAENPIFANIDSASNGGAGTYSVGPMQDQNLRTVYALKRAVGSEFKGDVQAFRLNRDGTIENDGRDVEADNPYGLSFFNRVFIPPVGDSTT